MTDPKVRKDGRCAQCRKPKPVLKPSLRKYAGDQTERDPFCSSLCCRRWFGIQIPGDDAPDELREIRAQSGRNAKQNYEAIRKGWAA